MELGMDTLQNRMDRTGKKMNLNIKVDMETFPTTSAISNHLSFNSSQLKQQKMHLSELSPIGLIEETSQSIVSLANPNFGGTPIGKSSKDHRKSRKIKSRKMKLIGSRKNIFDGMDKKLLDRNVSKDAYKEHRKNRSFKNVHAIKTNFKQKSVAVKESKNHARQATPSHVRSQTLPHGSGINILPRPKASSLALANSADCVDDVANTDSNIKEVKKRPNKIAAKYVMTKRSKAKITPTSPPLDNAPDSDNRHRMRMKELKQFVSQNGDAKSGSNSSSSRSNSMSVESATDFSTSASSEHAKSE